MIVRNLWFKHLVKSVSDHFHTDLFISIHAMVCVTGKVLLNEPPMVLMALTDFPKLNWKHCQWRLRTSRLSNGCLVMMPTICFPHGETLFPSKKVYTLKEAFVVHNLDN